VGVSGTVQEPTPSTPHPEEPPITVKETIAIVPSTVQDTYTRYIGLAAGVAPRRERLYRARRAEDGHSFAEQAVYQALWNAGAPESEAPDAPRTLRIGYDRLAHLTRLSWVSVKANLRKLESKLAIETIAGENSATREGKAYRIHSSEAILARRENAGLLWVRRTRGVELLTDLEAR
jgi:hypothetical protein